MALGQGGGNTGDGALVREKQINHLVIHDVVIEEVKKIIEVPDIKYISKEVDWPVIKEVETIKYIPREVITNKYNIEEYPTIKYTVTEVPCEKPIITDKEYERPVIKNKEYEKPVIVEKVYEVVTVTNLEQLKQASETIIKAADMLNKLEAHLNSLKEYVLQEEVIRVPKVEYYPVKAERIVWEDIKRERIV